MHALYSLSFNSNGTRMDHTLLSSSQIACLAMANLRRRSCMLLQDSWINEPKYTNSETHSTTSPSTTTFPGRGRKSLSDWIFIYFKLTSRPIGEITRAESSNPTNSDSRATSSAKSRSENDSAPILTPFIALGVVRYNYPDNSCIKHVRRYIVSFNPVSQRNQSANAPPT